MAAADGSGWKDQLEASHLDDPGIWTERLSGISSTAAATTGPLLSSLDRELRCQICYELYRAPVSLQPCQHTFCSECIRKALAEQYASANRRTRCVSCNEPVDHRNDKCLVPNRSLEQTVLIFAQLRTPLLRALLEETITTTTTPAARSTITSTRGRGKEGGTREVSTDDTLTRTTTTRRRQLPSSSSPRENDSDGDDEEDERIMRVDRHDRENNNTTTTQRDAVLPAAMSCDDAAPRQIVIMRPKKTKPFYNKKTKKQLRDLCMAEGLPDHGSEDDLRHRHAAFITLYNAECDSLHPLPVREIVMTIVKRERQRQQHYNAAVSYKDIEASRQLMQQMNEGFRQLIANAKKKQQQQQPTKKKNDHPGDDATATADAQSAEDKKVTPHVERFAIADNNKDYAEEEEPSSSSSRTDNLPQENSPNQEPGKFPNILPHERLSPSDDDPSSSSASPLTSNNDATRSSFFTQQQNKITLRENEVHAIAPREISSVVETPCESTEKGDELSISPHKRHRLDDSSLSPGTTPSGRTASSSRVVINPYQKQKQQTQCHNNGGALFFADFKPRHNNNNNQPRQSSSPHNVGGGEGSTMRTSNSSGTVVAPPLSRPSIIGPWSCNVCTFYNQTKIGSLAKCQMCQTARTTPPSAAPSSSASSAATNVLVWSP